MSEHARLGCTPEHPCGGLLVTVLQTDELTLRECLNAHSFREERPPPPHLPDAWLCAYCREPLPIIMTAQGPRRGRGGPRYHTTCAAERTKAVHWRSAPGEAALCGAYSSRRARRPDDVTCRACRRRLEETA